MHPPHPKRGRRYKKTLCRYATYWFEQPLPQSLEASQTALVRCATSHPVSQQLQTFPDANDAHRQLAMSSVETWANKSDRLTKCFLNVACFLEVYSEIHQGAKQSVHHSTPAEAAGSGQWRRSMANLVGFRKHSLKSQAQARHAKAVCKPTGTGIWGLPKFEGPFKAASNYC